MAQGSQAKKPPRKKGERKDPVKAQLPRPKAKDRAPHTTEIIAPVSVEDGTALIQSWDQDLADRLKALGEEMGIDDYDPVVEIARMAMSDNVEDHIKLKAHSIVAQYVRLKRQIEEQRGHGNITVNNYYTMPTDQRQRRIAELQMALGQDGAFAIKDE